MASFRDANVIRERYCRWRIALRRASWVRQSLRDRTLFRRNAGGDPQFDSPRGGRMSDPGATPTPLAGDEKLARFVFRRQWVRQDGTIKQDAFIPPFDLELSVTRHLNNTDSQLWQTGEEIAGELGINQLLGR